MWIKKDVIIMWQISGMRNWQINESRDIKITAYTNTKVLLAIMKSYIGSVISSKKSVIV